MGLSRSIQRIKDKSTPSSAKAPSRSGSIPGAGGFPRPEPVSRAVLTAFGPASFFIATIVPPLNPCLVEAFDTVVDEDSRYAGRADSRVPAGSPQAAAFKPAHRRIDRFRVSENSRWLSLGDRDSSFPRRHQNRLSADRIDRQSPTFLTRWSIVSILHRHGRFERFHPEIYAAGTRIDKVDVAAGNGVSLSSSRASCPANRARGLCLW